jgi:hypothetical protein
MERPTIRVEPEDGAPIDWHGHSPTRQPPSIPSTSGVFAIAMFVLLASGLGLSSGAGDEETNLALLVVSGLVSAIIGLRAILIWFLRPFVHLFKGR